jgi:hypothetical protein
MNILTLLLKSFILYKISHMEQITFTGTFAVEGAQSGDFVFFAFLW